MTKQTAQTLSIEEQNFLAEEAIREAKSVSSLPKMKQLAINSDKVDENNNKIEPDSWYVRNEGGYVKEVKFRPLRYVNKFIRMSQDGKKWRNDNESIFVSGFEPAFDARGTIGCGRIVGKLPETWTEEQKLNNFKKATIYGFLFGLVTFPGQKPELVNFRAAPAKAKVIREAISPKTIGDGIKMYNVEYTLKLTDVPKEKFPLFEMVPDLKHMHTSFKEVLPHFSEIDSYIAAHNTRIMKSREQLAANVKASATFEEVASLASDFKDDTIPF